jgi:hypothetical protein
MASRFPNLPRLEFTLLDDRLVALGDQNLTESVLIIGPALDGPTDRVIRVSNAGDIESIFGPVAFNTNYVGKNGEINGYSGNALMKAVREVQAGGCNDIRVLRAGGSSATGTFTMPAALNAGATGTITFTAKFGGRIYNQASVTFTSGATSGTVTIFQPISKRGNITINFSGPALSGITIAQIVDQINAHPDNRTVVAAVGSIDGTVAARLLNGSMTMNYGTDGTINDDLATNKYLLYTSLTESNGSFEIAQEQDVDNVLLAGIYLDDQVVSGDTTKSVALDFANFLGQRTVDHPMLGFIGTKPNNNPNGGRTATITHFNALNNPTSGNRTTNWTNAGYFLKTGFIYNDGTLEQPIDAGGYLQVVAADVNLSDTNLGLYTESAAALYCGFVASLPCYEPATYKPVNGIAGMPYQFTKAQLNTLVGGIGQDPTQGILGGGAYVTIKNIEGRGVLWVMDATASQRKSDFKNLQPLRIANTVHKQIKKIAFPYLGKPNDLARRNALATQIKGMLDSLAEAGALLGKEGLGYTLEVRGGVNPLDNLLGIIDVNIMLRPALQIKAIRVKLRLSL